MPLAMCSDILDQGTMNLFKFFADTFCRNLPALVEMTDFLDSSDDEDELSLLLVRSTASALFLASSCSSRTWTPFAAPNRMISLP